MPIRLRFAAFHDRTEHVRLAFEKRFKGSAPRLSAKPRTRTLTQKESRYRTVCQVRIKGEAAHANTKRVTAHSPKIYLRIYIIFPINSLVL